MKEKYNSSITIRISGDVFPIDNFLEKIDIKPVEIYKKGEPFLRGLIQDTQPFTAWEFTINSSKFKYTDDQIEYLFQKLSPYLDTITDYQKKYNLKCETIICVRYDEYQTPGIHFEPNHINFLQKIKSSVDIDIYNLCSEK
ncbi:DUF4279 domain-containing protein [Metasolibacillus meyeri]|uniref:DUF4279 domain-containing protein n=1 Tax=Metasolibacillus meyeri TaxID=1071052 RepID=A0AAW9NRR9_9BACL|nr:DUF4279 domain-containing protein [Metasolibacillus meyeri]MEC1178394.1 DUF4279 domain-containing protein [Metasolibacillus meyeri]